MARLSGRTRGRAAARLTTAAIAAALVGTSAGAAVADSPAPAPAPVKSLHKATERLGDLPQAAPRTAGVAAAPILPLFAATRSGDLYMYRANGHGGLKAREFVTRWQTIDASVQAVTGNNVALYTRTPDGTLNYSDGAVKRIGTGWGQYDLLRSVGNVGGAKQADLLARDRSGALWLYLAKSDGTLTGRKKVGTGWGQYTQLAGQGDLTGDGKADLVAVDRSGVAWLYKGTGDYTKPFASRSRIGTGWGQFNHVLSTGDLTFDGRADLVARDKAGALWVYAGTGRASAPFKAKKKIGASGWNQYAQLF
ncbi:VCBS repeat-containing protein [Streptomyces sp. XD-27]|uniref:VCBS repeat-containing protein n=1 Tax=Streptomyces sp. XD-27 TaxID=3062779 RepID=UPI0026F43AC7|nr:VCBS repeat-containing protein [Streptomyces sp. XD-27]WKX73065.1 VCBS repeat-containing protein [Streptomyces sp. XD-27]